MNIYAETDYRKVVRDLAKEQGQSMRQLGAQAKIHSSYLSRVMTGDTNFSPDQLFRLAGLLRLDANERDYLLLLLELATAGDHDRQTVLRAKIRDRRAEHNRMEVLLKNPDAPILQSQADFAEYYREIVTAKIHMHLTIPTYRADPQRLAAKLNVSPPKLAAELRKLEKLGIIQRDGPSVVTVKDFVHLDARHPESVQNHVNWRLASIHHLNTRDGRDDDYHFSVVFSSDARSKGLIRDAFKAFVVEVEKIVRSSKEDEVFQMGFDLY